MNWNEELEDDLDAIFFDAEEFTTIHLINRKRIPVILDDYEKMEREKTAKQYIDGISKRKLLLYVRAKDFGKLPNYNSRIKIDEQFYLVKDATDEDGVYSILLEANQ